MKKLFIATLLLGSASFANADYKLVSADSSSLSSLCLEAAASPSKVYSIARAHGVLAADIGTIRCNDLPLKSFVSKYGKQSAVSAVAEASVAPAVESSRIAGYLLRKTDSSPLTELCAAALVSDQEVAKVKELHFSGDAQIESEIQCNGQPLKSFVRKYRDAEVQLVGFR